MSFFKKDHLFSGMAAAFLLQSATILLILLINIILKSLHWVDVYISIKNLIPLSMLPDLQLMRNYFLKYKMEKAGAGNLLLMFVVMLVFFILHLKFNMF